MSWLLFTAVATALLALMLATIRLLTGWIPGPVPGRLPSIVCSWQPPWFKWWQTTLTGLAIVATLGALFQFVAWIAYVLE